MKQFISHVKSKLPKGRQDKRFPYAHGILLVLTLMVIFIVPVFPKIYFTILYPVLVTGIFLSAALAVKHDQKFDIAIAVILTALFWIGQITEMKIVITIIRVLQFSFFLFLVASLVAQISKTATVTPAVITDSIIGYLLLGFSFSLIVTNISLWLPDAYSVVLINRSGSPDTHFIKDNLYYTFMTFTTTGYGDIVPKHPLAKSLAVLIAVSGQLYIAVIIAMLVGKYASSEKSNS